MHRGAAPFDAGRFAAQRAAWTSRASGATDAQLRRVLLDALFAAGAADDVPRALRMTRDEMLAALLLRSIAARPMA